MSAIQMHNMLTFDGLMAQSMSFSCSQNVDLATSFHNDFVITIPGIKQAELSCDIIVSSANNGVIDNIVEKLWGNDRNLVNLGPGRVCEYCGEYKVAGELKCHRCGGTTKEEQFVTVNSFPFLLVNYHVNMPYGELTILSLDMRSNGPVDNFILEQLVKGISLETLPHALTLDLSKYLCEWCGMIVESGKICPGCGGTRLPLSEIVKMDHECLYCGKRITGGIVCQSCGARLSGLSYHIVKGKGYADHHRNRQDRQ